MRPIETDAFETALQRARGRFGRRKLDTGPAGSSYSAASLRLESEPHRPFVLVAEREQRLYPVEPRRIDYVESAGNYVKIHVDKCEYIARESIKHLEVVLRPAGGGTRAWSIPTTQVSHFLVIMRFQLAATLCHC